MNGETVILSVILLVSAVPVMMIGIVQYRSRHPVGFWSGKEPPKEEELTDVKAYNQKHGLMWMLYGLGMILCFGWGAAFGSAAAWILCMIEVTGGILGMIAYHNKLNRMYCKKEGGLEKSFGKKR